ncbi:nidogen 2 L homeolog isoform X1 [Xenopus laevis]|uniref:Nidogen 2 L homeolog isoform X1 n=1 Tax=Xenopus laevis TaxID=8355 RepID=A0A8J0TF48_XENLA|nr:nidogen 2 L homeolog isoform X1 [Xenopus laevis]
MHIPTAIPAGTAATARSKSLFPSNQCARREEPGVILRLGLSAPCSSVYWSATATPTLGSALGSDVEAPGSELLSTLGRGAYPLALNVGLASIRIVAMWDRTVRLLLPLHCLLAFSAAISRRELFPYGELKGDVLLQEGDDETSEVVKLSQPLLFYEAQFSNLYVGTNGIISTQDFPRETQYVDDGFPTDFPVIAPFLSDIDTSNGKGKIFYRQDNSEPVLNHAAREIQRGFPEATFIPNHAFLVTWENVGTYEEVTRHSASSDRRNTFQAVLAYDHSDAYAIFLYPEDGLQFFGTRPKESYNVHIELPARVGFSRSEAGPYYSVTSNEQSVKNLYQTGNVGVPGIWVFHIGSIWELDNVIPAKFFGAPANEQSLENSHTSFPEHRLFENHENEDSIDYPESFYEESEDELEDNTSDATPTHETHQEGDSNTGNQGYLDIDDQASKLTHAEDEQKATSSAVLSSSHQNPNWTPYTPSESETDRDGPLQEPQIQTGENLDLTREDTLLTDDLPSHNAPDSIPSNSEDLPIYPESAVLVGSHPEQENNFERGRQTDADPGLQTDVFSFKPAGKETCERNHGRCSRFAFCADYSTGFCCHCQEDYYGNGVHCLPRGAPHRVNGKVSGNILVGQTPVNFIDADLHAYIVANDGRAYTAISNVPDPASWSLTPLAPIGGLFGWLFALEKPGFQNGFSFTGAKFVHNIDVTFYPGEEAIHITQTANGFDSEGYMNVKTAIQGKIPYIPETSTIKLSPYTELYQYSGSVVTSTAYREYTVLSESNEEQKLSYRLRQNVTYQECSHSQKQSVSAQKLYVDRVFALYNKEEKVLRYAITNYIGSVHDSTGEEDLKVNPCYDGTHLCDTRAKCQPGSGLEYICVCASGYQGDGRDCTDVNECEVGFTRCGQNTVCVNLQGSYRCECASGFTLSGDEHNCILASSINPCEDGRHMCNRDTSRCVPHGDGVYTCQCFPGFIMSGEKCVDVDECTEHRCHPDASCTNTLGSFSCRCNSGYEGDGFQCTQILDPEPLRTPCLEKRQQLLGQLHPRGPRPVVGQFVPECDAEGNYVPLQCHGSTGHCWCVDKLGEEVAETRTPPGRPSPNCGDKGPEPLRTPCLEKRQQLLGQLHPRGSRPVVGQFVPECDAEGNYVPLQCHGSTGHCWCVDKLGEEIAGTRTQPGRTSPNCADKGPEPLRTPCLEKRQQLLGQLHSRGPHPIVGQFVPECDVEGNYVPLQCHGSTGHCWCVDKLGEEVAGTRTPPGRPSPNCGDTAEPTQRPQTVCERWKQSLIEHYGGKPSGEHYVPQCDQYGDFSPLQCHGNSGYCWCVDKEGREIEGSRTEPGMTPACIPTVAPPTMHPTPRPDVTPPATGTFLLYAQGQQIGYLPLNGTRLHKDKARTLLSLHGSIVVGIDYDCHEKMVYWTDVAGRTINRASLEPGAEAEIIINTGLMSTEGLAIDYLRRTLFWTDSGLDKIESSRLDGTERKILFDTQLVNPRAITVDAVRGNLYWTDWNREAPKIESSFVDGSNRRILVNDNIGLPNGLTFDPFSKQVCWADAGTKKLECILSDGTGRRVIQSNLNYPFSVVAYANHFYHTDWRRDGVISIKKDTGHIVEEYLPEQRSHLYGITAVYPYCPSGRK